MFAYVEQDSYLHSRNPVIKLVVILALTVAVSLSYFPVLPALTFLLAFLVIWIGGRISLGNLIRRLLIFLIISTIFMVSMLLLRGLGEEPDTICRLGVFQWSIRDFVHVLSLGFRILALITMSLGFVLTTRPRDIVLSLIMQCRVSHIHGYAALAAYRFLPELQSQVDNIHLAQEIRGIPWNKGALSRLLSPFRVLMPLLCVAARRGERVACAMDSRGLGRSQGRSYYTKITITRQDWIFLTVAILIYTMLIVLLIKMDMFQFSFAFVNHQK